jgi:uncharacterized membrane protein
MKARSMLADLALLIRRYPLWLAVSAAVGLVFFASPGDYTSTSYRVLHGLCAQTPSHTIHFGDRPLPFDARMTGIYGGVIVTLATLLVRRRMFHYGNPPRRVVMLLGAFVVGMAFDGFNSLFTDLDIWHPWESSSISRVVTGYGVGVALAVALCWLLSSSTWRMSKPEAGVGSPRDLVVPAVGLAAYGVLLVWSPSWLHLPVSMMLVISAWITVTMLVLVIVLLALNLDSSVRSIRELHVPVAMAGLLAVTVMLGLAGLRFWVEHTIGFSNAML